MEEIRLLNEAELGPGDAGKAFRVEILDEGVVMAGRTRIYEVEGNACAYAMLWEKNNREWRVTRWNGSGWVAHEFFADS